MGQKVAVTLNLTATATGYVELPDAYTWDDVAFHYVKWGTLYVTFKDGTEWNADSSPEMCQDSIDWKRPESEIYGTDSDGSTDYDNPLG